MAITHARPHPLGPPAHNRDSVASLAGVWNKPGMTVASDYSNPFTPAPPT